MENRRNLLIIAVIVLVCITLACGGSVSPTEDEKPAEEPTATEVAVVEPTEAPADTPVPEPTEAPEVCTRCGRTDTLVPEPTATVEVAATDTPIPEPTTWMGLIDCPECEGIPLALWEKIDEMGQSPGKVNHGDTCIVLDKGVTDGIEKYKLDCDGKVGWLRSEGIKPAE